MRLAIADPPYPGQAKRLYGDHPDYAGEVDHAELLTILSMYDGWVLHTSSVALPQVLPLVPSWDGVRVMAWVKPFAAFKRNIPVAYAWEPVLVKAARKPVVSSRLTLRDWVSEPITMRRGLAGAKPDRVCRWTFEVMGADPDDSLDDLYPGTGAVTDAWQAWRSQLNLLSGEPS